jgi:glycosyltransferase involved in cell wall biosynthesis
MIGHKRIPSREGGIEIVVGEIAKRMVERGHTVHAYNRKGHHISGRENDAIIENNYLGIRIISIPTINNSKFNAIIYTILATFRALFGRYSVIHFHAEGPCSMIWLPKLIGTRTVATIHGLDWQRAKWGGFATSFLKFGEKMAARYADEIIVLSQNIQEYFIENYGRKTWFIPNAIDEPKRREVDCISKKYDLKGNDYILFLARIVPEKGLHYLLDAYKQLNTDKKLIIVGCGSHSDEYTNRIHEQVKGDDRIIFTGFVQGTELDELYSNAYVYVLPSDIEGMPISLLEAMSYGNCCLVSDIPENKEVVEDHAITFKKGSVESLRGNLEELLNKPDIVDIYRKGSSLFICNKYNWNNVVDQTLALYTK